MISLSQMDLLVPCMLWLEVHTQAQSLVVLATAESAGTQPVACCWSLGALMHPNPRVQCYLHLFIMALSEGL